MGDEGQDNSFTRRDKLRLSFGSTSGIPPRRKQIPAGLPCHFGQIPIERPLPLPQHQSGTLKLSPTESHEFTAEDLEDLGVVGCGMYGTVSKMIHKKTATIMAVKRIRSTVDEKQQKVLLKELDVVMRSDQCPFIVQFYGALFKEGDCWICMELMDTSLDKFYKFVYDTLHERIPESILGKIAVATVRALNYLKQELSIIHRDVKPSNILMNKSGQVKLCDFGISGQLVDSIARTKDAGCQPYMAPERIDPTQPGQQHGYGVATDVWSLGITLVEVSIGRFPYRSWDSVFDQLSEVVQGAPPHLQQSDGFSPEYIEFVNRCLTKDGLHRPKYDQLLADPFILRAEADNINIAEYISGVLEHMKTPRNTSTSNHANP